MCQKVNLNVKWPKGSDLWFWQVVSFLFGSSSFLLVFIVSQQCLFKLDFFIIWLARYRCSRAPVLADLAATRPEPFQQMWMKRSARFSGGKKCCKEFRNFLKSSWSRSVIFYWSKLASKQEPGVTFLIKLGLISNLNKSYIQRNVRLWRIVICPTECLGAKLLNIFLHCDVTLWLFVYKANYQKL